jgi:glycine/D-amino acid oxidase-like deaminating enzyme
VIGGGIVGVCVALHAQGTGRQVTVVERRTPGWSASGHNGGVLAVAEPMPVGEPAVVRRIPQMLRDPLSPLAIRWSYLPRLAPWLVRFLLASRVRRVEAIGASLHGLTAHVVDAYLPLLADCPEAARHVRDGGALQVYGEDGALAGAGLALQLRRRFGASFALLDDEGITAQDPFLAGRFRRAIHFPDWWSTTDPEALTLALADRFRHRGGAMLRAEVHGFVVRGGKVTGIETSSGGVEAGEIVIAAGAWSRRLVRQLGFDVPLDTERGYGVDLPAPGFTLRFPLVSGDHHFAMTPLRSGLRLAGTAELAGLAAPPNYARADTLVKAARLAFPELRSEDARPWMAFRPSLPDSLPVIGRAPRHPGVYLAFGHGHKGLGQAAITGKLIQELLDGKEPTVDLAPFRPTRFMTARGLSSRLRARGAGRRS